jgi:hypothetical protein|nr:MAG TPA: hypothetical protein [Caudoviricetes sp.]
MKLTKKQVKKFQSKPVKRDYDREMEITGIVLNTIAAGFLKVLHDDYGFGKKRLTDVKEKVEYQLACMADKYVRYTDILEMIKQETGLDWFEEKD